MDIYSYLDDLTPLVWKAKELYVKNDLPYHNWAHAKDVAHQAASLANENCGLFHKFRQGSTKTGMIRSLILAAFWHDAIYDPSNSTDNEIKSSAALRMAAESLKAHFMMGTSGVVRQAVSMIIGTTIADHIRSDQVGLITYLLDADVSNLGSREYEDFVLTQRLILLERGLPDTTESLCLSSEFLQRVFLSKKNIYRTKEAQRRWEDQARANLTRFVAEFKPMKSPLVESGPKMVFDPATGEKDPKPDQPEEWRQWNGKTAWLFNPWDGSRRDARDVGSDTFGHLIV